MNNRISLGLSFASVLAAIIAGALGTSPGWSQSTVTGTRGQPTPTFEVASVKINKSNARAGYKAFPSAGRITVTNMPVTVVIQRAYGLQPYQLVHGNNPILNERIDIEARTGRPMDSGAQMQQMMQPLLAERFNLVVHRESREMDGFVLTLAKDGRLGPKIKKSDRDCGDLATSPPLPGERPACGFIPSGVGRIVGFGLDMPAIIETISPGGSPTGRPMVDESGLRDRYDIDVTYTPTPFSAATLAQTGREPMPGVDPNGPSLMNAIEEQLGFKLQPKKMPIPVVVIDHIEPLTEN